MRSRFLKFGLNGPKQYAKDFSRIISFNADFTF